MSDRSDQVQRLLSALARHADLVCEALEGSIHGGSDRQRNAGIESLFDLGIIKPYDENEYRINPRLREFFNEHFSSYQAFQALRRISSTMQQAHEQWRELRRLKMSGASKDIHHLTFALDESVADMGHAIEHNLTMLHSLLSTQYGNVHDFKLKLRQNHYYARQVAQFLRDAEGIMSFVEHVSDEAIACGLADVRRMVMRRLGSKILTWTAQIKDAQQLISKRLFEARIMEQRFKLLARFGLWLNRHKTSDGWEISDESIEASPSLAIFRPDELPVRPQPDVSHSDPLIERAMISALEKMPAKKFSLDVHSHAKVVGDQLLIDDGTEEFFEEFDPVRLVFSDLIAALSTTHGEISLIDWKRGRQDLCDFSDEAWLMYSSTQLRSKGVGLTFVRDTDNDPFPINEAFNDVKARWLHGDRMASDRRAS